MAKSNDKGLYLPLKVDLTEWEKSLAQADADLQKAMRQLKSKTNDLKLKYDVEIAGAKAAGNDVKALELEEKKLTAIFETQKQAVNALNKAYQQSVKEKGADAQASKALARQLINESKAMERTQAQLQSKGFGALGKSISNSLAGVSPEFAKVRSIVSGITTELSGMGSTALMAAKALGGIGVVVAGLGAAYTGFSSLINSYKETAEAAANANEEVYQLREELNISYKEAETLAGAARIDGVNIQSLNASINQLYKNLDAGNEKGKKALALLQEYGASITDLNGKRKGVTEMFSEIQKAFLNAESMGKGRDFLTGIFGASSDQFLHFIRGFDYYIAEAKQAQIETEKEYDASHRLLDLKKKQAEVERQLASVKGDSFVQGAVTAREAEIAGLQEQIKLYMEASDKLKGYADEMKNLALAQEGASLAWEKFKISLKSEGMQLFDNTWQSIKKINDLYKEFKENTGFNAKFLPFGNLIEGLHEAVSGIQNAEKDIQQQMIEAESQAEIDHMQSVIDEKDRMEEQAARSQLIKTQQEEAKKAEIRKKYNDAMFNATASDYEKQIKAISDERDAFIQAKISEAEANELYAKKKAKIDADYYAKNQKQAEENAKKQEAIYKKQVESQKSEAEKVLTQQKDLWKAYLQYGDSGKFQEFALNQQLKKMGIDKKDYEMMDDWRLQGFKEAMERFNQDTWLNKLNDAFLPTTTAQLPTGNGQGITSSSVNNTITVNIDRPILTDESLINQLTDRVAEKITVVAETAFVNKAQNAF